MNYRMILRLLSVTLCLVAAFMIPALAISLIKGETAAALGFAIAMAVMLLFSLSTRLLPPRKKTLYAREGYVAVALTWIMVSALGALPFYISRAIPSYIDCLFETVSGFTTTGASILSDVESLPMGLLYWRSFSHWLGGMGVLVFLLAISSIFSHSGDSIFLMRAESPGPQVSKLVPRTMGTSQLLYGIYFVLTASQIILLLLGGMPLFDAVTLSFGTAGTGGFSIKNDSLMSYTPYQQNVVTVFMLLFGVNFGVYYLILKRSFRRAARDEELRMYLATIAAAIVIVFVSTFRLYTGRYPFADALRHAAFQVVSIITTTGFSTVDYEVWPQICHTILLMLMLIGACAGSTGGGVKCSRILILLRGIQVETQRLLHPSMVRPVRMDGKTVADHTVRGVYAFFGVYACIALISIALVSLDNYSFETSVSAVIACLNNIGPGFGVVGPTGNFASFSPGIKLLLTLDMLIGRLEIFPILLLCLPQVWTRSRV